MAEVKSTFLRFVPSDSIDVVTNKMYMEESPAVVVQKPANPEPEDVWSLEFDLGNFINSDGLVEVDISSLPGMTTTDGVYNIGVAAVDDRGNEASMSLLNDVPFDFIAPNQVGVLVVSET